MDGLSAGRVAQSAARAWNVAYQNAGGDGERDFAQKALARVAVTLEESEVEGTLAEMGVLLAAWYAEAAGLPAQEGLAPTPAERCAWEALAAHLFVLLNEGEDVDLDDLESSWGTWAKEQLPVGG